MNVAIMFLLISLMSGLRKDSWILISPSVFNLLWYYTLCGLWKTTVTDSQKGK